MAVSCRGVGCDMPQSDMSLANSYLDVEAVCRTQWTKKLDDAYCQAHPSGRASMPVGWLRANVLR
jgi:hypothetical protein